MRLRQHNLQTDLPVLLSDPSASRSLSLWLAWRSPRCLCIELQYPAVISQLPPVILNRKTTIPPSLPLSAPLRGTLSAPRLMGCALLHTITKDAIRKRLMTTLGP